MRRESEIPCMLLEFRTLVFSGVQAFARKTDTCESAEIRV